MINHTEQNTAALIGTAHDCVRLDHVVCDHEETMEANLYVLIIIVVLLWAGNAY